MLRRIINLTALLLVVAMLLPMVASNALDHGSYVTYYGTTGYHNRAYVKIQETKDSSTTMRYLYTETIKL